MVARCSPLCDGRPILLTGQVKFIQFPTRVAGMNSGSVGMKKVCCPSALSIPPSLSSSLPLSPSLSVALSPPTSLALPITPFHHLVVGNRVGGETKSLVVQVVLEGLLLEVEVGGGGGVKHAPLVL